MFKKSFAIKIGKTLNDRILADAIKELAKNYPKLKVEGITKSVRGAKKLDPVISKVGGTLLVEKHIEERDYITVGFNEKTDISFETKSSIYAFGFVPLVKILDIQKDFDEIMDRLGLYVITKFPNRTIKALKNNFRVKKSLKNNGLLEIGSLLISPKSLKVAKKKTKKALDYIVIVE